MKFLRTSPGNLAASYMTSRDSSAISKYCSLNMDTVKMESNSCVAESCDSIACESDAYRITSTNGCLKNASINESTSVSNRVSNNNSGVVGGFSVDSSTQCDHDPDHRVSQTMTELNGCHATSISSPINGNKSCISNHCGLPDKGETTARESRFPPDGELSSVLSTMVLSTGESTSVPSVEMPVNGSHCDGGIQYIVYESERQMGDIMKLITKDLSEPYSIYTYRYFIHNWPRLCYLAMDGEKCVGAIVCKLDRHRSTARRGYIAMLAVDQGYRQAGIGSNLVVHAIKSMTDPASGGCDEVVLETEISNSAALRLYEKLGFVRDKRLFRYYLNGVDALRLKLWLK